MEAPKDTTGGRVILAGDRGTHLGRLIWSGKVESAESYLAALQTEVMKLTFPVIRLWEHASCIRSGELPELAPLLLLCEETPTVETVQEEVALIHASRLPRETQAELLGLALLVATRRFARESLLPIFREDWNMIQGLEIIEDMMRETGKIDQWIAEGEARGEARGKTEAVREMTLRFLTQRFGTLPEDLVKRIEAADAIWCQHLFDQAIEAETLEDINLDGLE